MIPRILITLLLAAGLLYWALKEISVEVASRELASADWKMLFPMTMSYSVAHVLRSHRLGLLLGKPVTLRQLVSINAIGYLAINVLPLRLGEFMRPLLLRQDCGIPLGRSIGAIFLERLLDLIVLVVAIAAVIGLSDSTSKDLNIQGVDIVAMIRWIAGLILIVGILGVGVLVWKGDHWLDWMQERLPTAVWVTGLIDFVRHFRSAVTELVEKPRITIATVLDSLGLYLFAILATWSVLSAFEGVPTGPISALIVFTITVVGVTIAPTPGFFGSFEAFCVASLLLLGVDQALAAVVAIVLHLGQLGFTLSLGVLFLGLDGISVRLIMKQQHKNI